MTARHRCTPGTIAVLAALLVSGCAADAGSASPSTSPLELGTTAAARPWVADAALTRTLTLDGGTLRLDPPTADTMVQEDRVLALWRSGDAGSGDSFSISAEVIVARADITFPDELPGGGTTRGERPRFQHRTGWVVFSDNAGASNCASLLDPSPPVDGPPVRPVWLLSGDGTEAVQYDTAGTDTCRTSSSGPTASTSGYTSRAVPVGSGTPSTCSMITGSSGVGTPSGYTSTTWMFTTLSTGPCALPDATTSVQPGALGVGRSTGMGDLTWYDGAVHHID